MHTLSIGEPLRCTPCKIFRHVSLVACITYQIADIIILCSIYFCAPVSSKRHTWKGFLAAVSTKYEPYNALITHTCTQARACTHTHMHLWYMQITGLAAETDRLDALLTALQAHHHTQGTGLCASSVLLNTMCFAPCRALALKCSVFPQACCV